MMVINWGTKIQPHSLILKTDPSIYNYNLIFNMWFNTFLSDNDEIFLHFFSDEVDL